jgi:membrane-bound inhibitor of C-type lysozyme
MLRMLKYFKHDITKMTCSGMKDATEMMTFWSNGQRGKGLSVSSIERYFDGKYWVWVQHQVHC